MKHLTVDEMIDFVSLTELNADAMMLSATVNGHIRKCDQCLQRVKAFQMVYDEFSRLRESGEFKKYIINKVQNNTRLAATGVETEELETYE